MEAIGQLTGGVAHDFNNLLTIVLGNLESIQRNAASLDAPDAGSRLRRAADNAMRGAQRAAALTQRLLAFSRRQPLDPKPVDVNRLVTGMSELLRRTLGEQIEIETVLGAGLWRTLADPNQLENALLNLAVNARDAMPDGGKLTIETGNAHLDERYAAGTRRCTAGQYVMIARHRHRRRHGAGGARRRRSSRSSPPRRPARAPASGCRRSTASSSSRGGHVKIYSEPGRARR